MKGPEAETAGAQDVLFRPERFNRQASVVRLALASAAPDAPPDEQLLHQLIADEAALLAALQESQWQVMNKLQDRLNEPRLALVLARMLRELMAMSTMLDKRMEHVVTTAASLRTQRKIFEQDGILP